MIIVYTVLIFVAWCFIGDVICYINTKISMRTIFGKMNFTQESFEKQVSKDTLEEYNYVPDDVTVVDIIRNTILWPRTLFLAHRGHKKFVEKHKEDNLK